MSESQPSTGSLKIEEILACLPHSYPMLLVDRILEMNYAARTCVGIKNVSMNEPFFHGHYPGKPIMPGVLIIESMAQVGACLLLSVPETTGMVPLIGAIDDVKFKRMVVPGDQLRIEVDMLWVRSSIGRIKCVGTVDGDVVATMELTFKLVRNS